MNSYSKIIVPLFLLVAFSTSVTAQTGHMTLLAVSETDDGFIGGTADLDLEMRPGTGRVFLETYPFTEVDTQMSTRFANEIACDYVNADCSQYDFFYTIAAGSSIVAGPSAGAAMTALTVALLEGETVDETVAITGTINSGGIIGPVGGISAKVEAAATKDIDTVLIPFGFAALSNSTQNETPQQVGERLNIQVVQVTTIDEVLHYFLGYPLPERKQVMINPQYQETMRSLSQDLCERSEQLLELVQNSSELEGAENLTAQADIAIELRQYYAAASYCYGANVAYVTKVLEEQNLTAQRKAEYAANLQNKIHRFHHKLDNFSVMTITDLEAYMIVKERLDEAQKHLDNEKNRTNVTRQSLVNLAWATERFHSAESWFTFAGKEGKEYSINKASLSQSCVRKIGEVDQRIKYMEQFAFLPIDHIREDLEGAREQLAKENYELCLFKASKAKGSIGVVLSVLGVSEQSFNELLDTKLAIVSEELAEQSEQGTFPILGYSYYEYALSLREHDLISALLYAEYALEMGTVDMYFTVAPHERKRTFSVDKSKLLILLIGISIGLIAGLMIRIGYVWPKPRKRKNSSTKR